MKNNYLTGIAKYAATALAVGTLSFSNYARADMMPEQEVSSTNPAYVVQLIDTNSNYQTISSLENSLAQNNAPAQNTSSHKSSGGSFFPFILLYWYFFLRSRD